MQSDRGRKAHPFSFLEGSGGLKRRALRLWASAAMAMATLAGPTVSGVAAGDSCIGTGAAATTVDHFKIEKGGTSLPVPDQIDATEFSIKITAQNSANATCTAFTGVVSLSLPPETPANIKVGAGPGATTAAFVGGVRTEKVTITGVPEIVTPLPAQITASMVGAPIASLLVMAPGSGYTTTPACTIGAPPTGGVQATCTTTLTGGMVSAVTLTAAGSGYTSEPPTCEIASSPTTDNAACMAIPGLSASGSSALFNVTNKPGAATKLVFTQVSSLTTLAASNGSNLNEAVSTDYTVEFQDANGPAEKKLRYVKLSSNSPFATAANTTRTGQFSKVTYTTTGTPPNTTTNTALGAIPTGCTSIPVTAEPSLTFRYRDSAPTTDGFTRAITAAAYTDAACTTIDTTINANSTPPNVAPVPPSGPLIQAIVTSGGSGYTSTPFCTISGGGGNGAICTATIDTMGQVTSILLDATGSGFTSTPTCTISGGGGTGAACFADFIPNVSGNLKIQVAPKSVTLTGLGFGTPGKVQWQLINPSLQPYQTVNIDSVAQCTDISSTVKVDRDGAGPEVAWAPASKVNCIQSWPTSGKTVKFTPPPADFGSHGVATYVPATGLSGVNSLETLKDSFKPGNGFYYGPTVTDVSPQTNSEADDAAGGTIITIKGYGFGPKPVVKFGELAIDTGSAAAKCATSDSTSKGCWQANPTSIQIKVHAPTRAAAQAAIPGCDAIQFPPGCSSFSVTVQGQELDEGSGVDQQFHYDKAVTTKIEGDY